VNVSGSTITVTANGGDLAEEDYWVTVQGGGLTESSKVRLTVQPFPPVGIITIAFGEIPNEPVNVTGGTAITRGQQLQVTVSNGGSYSRFEWRLDGVALDQQTAATCVVDSSGLALGRHRLLAVAYKGGVPFSKELVFTVTN
jgi:hypothetical protein